MNPLVPSKELETTTVTLTRSSITDASVCSSGPARPRSPACRTFGISHTTYYRWADRAERYGLAALMPKCRRSPAMPNAIPPETLEIVLAEAVARPTLGARRLLEHLAERKVTLSASGVQKVLVRPVSAVATSGLPPGPDHRRRLRPAHRGGQGGPFGFCHFAVRPADLVTLDTFYVGKLKGVGTVWQRTAVDTATRWAVCRLFVGDRTAQAAADFVDHVIERLAEIAVELTGVLTDHRPEFTGKAFTGHLGDLGVAHHRIPPRSPKHNPLCERFQGAALQEFHHPAFHRQRFDRLDELDGQFQGWIGHYNTHQRNRRLHARPHARDRAQLSGMAIRQRVHLSPRLVRRKG